MPKGSFADVAALKEMRSIETHSPISGARQLQKLHYEIGILFFNRASQTLESVLSFLGEELQPEIIILDQGSSPEQRQFLDAALGGRANIRFVTLTQNIGVAAGRNRLSRECSSEWVLFVDNDITLNTRSGVAIIEAAVRNAGDVDGITPRLFNVHENRFIDRLRLAGSLESRLSEQIVVNDETTNIFPGGAVVLRRSVLLAQPYDERYFVGFEDYELALRAYVTRRPLRVKALPEVTLAHKHLPVLSEPDIASTRIRYSASLIEKSARVLEQTYGEGLFSDWKKWVLDQRKDMLERSTVASPAPAEAFDIAIVVDEKHSQSDKLADELERDCSDRFVITKFSADIPSAVALQKIMDHRPQLIHFMHRGTFLRMLRPAAIAECAILSGRSDADILDELCQSQITFSAGDPNFLSPADIEKFRPFYWLSDGYCITAPRLTEVCRQNSDCPKPTASIYENEERVSSWLSFFLEIIGNARPSGPAWRRLMIEKFYMAGDCG